MGQDRKWDGSDIATPAEALKTAVELAGNQTALAEICGCTQGAISQMLLRPDPRLSHQFVVIVSATFDIPRSSLRPDLYPREAEAAQTRAA